MKRALHTSQYFFDGKHESLPIVIRKRRGTRRIVLRYQPLKHCLTLSLPFYVSQAKGLNFVEEKRLWVISQIEKHPPRVPFAHGEVIPLLGKEYRLVHTGGRGLVRTEGENILVPGEAAFMPRRLSEWLVEHAKKEIVPRAHGKAALIDKEIAKITLRDMRSLWGSCDRHGKISFSWRLILAPENILDYVVSHEVAHLAQLNHSAAFWKIVGELCPHWKESRAWLKAHGDGLYRYR